MKTIRELNIKGWSGYVFTDMTNINDFDPEFLRINDFKGCKDGSTLFNLCYCEENNVSHIVFNNIECIFRKCGMYSYLIFCESDKNKKMLNNYIQVIDKIKEEILSFIDELEDDLFIMGKDFMRFRFKTNDKLPNNQKINVPVCVISISSVLNKDDWYYFSTRLQECSYENDYLDKKEK